MIAATGTLAGRQLTIEQNKQTTPAVDLDLNYEVTANLTEKTAVLQKLDVAGRQKGSPFLRTALDRPMNLNWGTTAKAMPVQVVLWCSTSTTSTGIRAERTPNEVQP